MFSLGRTEVEHIEEDSKTATALVLVLLELLLQYPEDEVKKHFHSKEIETWKVIALHSYPFLFQEFGVDKYSDCMKSSELHQLVEAICHRLEGQEYGQVIQLKASNKKK